MGLGFWLNLKVMEEKDGCRNQIIFGAIWLTGGLINSIFFGLILKEDNGILGLIPFALPALSFLLGIRIMQAKDLARWIFGKKLEAIDDEVNNPKKRYGSTVIFASLFLFLVGGFLTSIFQDTSPNHYKVYLLGGLIWGVIWYLLMQNKIVNHFIDTE